MRWHPFFFGACTVSYHLNVLCMQIAVGVSAEKLQPVVPPNLPAGLQVVASFCCNFDPYERPSFETVAKELEEVVQELKVCCSSLIRSPRIYSHSAQTQRECADVHLG